MRKRKQISVGRLFVRNKEIWDYRNLPLKIKLQICWRLIFTGIVEIQWKKLNITNIYIEGKK